MFIYAACGQKSPNISPDEKSELTNQKLQEETGNKSVFQNRKPSQNDVTIIIEKS